MPLYQPYSPASPPAPSNAGELTRAAWDEFYRLEAALAQLDRPVASTVTASESVPVGPTVQYDTLFDEGLTYEYEQPGGQTNGATGIWTAPQEGLYQISSIIEVPAFPTPANKLYTASLRTTLTIPGSAPQTFISTSGGSDTVPLRIVSIVSRPVLKGSTVLQELDLTHETKTGTVTVLAVRSILRVSGYK